MVKKGYKQTKEHIAKRVTKMIKTRKKNNSYQGGNILLDENIGRRKKILC